MNWKLEATERLQRLGAVRLAAKNLDGEIRRLEKANASLRGTQVELVTVRKTAGRKEDHLLDNLVYRGELELALEDARDWLAVTETALSVLDPEERLLLHGFYIAADQYSLGTLCGQLGLEKSSIYRKRDKALEKFTLALYGQAS